MNQEQTAPRFNRWLASGVVVFGTQNDKGETQPLGSAPINTILSKPGEAPQNIAIKDISRIQQQMQANFIQKIGFETPVQILDVVVNNISLIAINSTDAEWQEGMPKEEGNEQQG